MDLVTNWGKLIGGALTDLPISSRRSKKSSISFGESEGMKCGEIGFWWKELGMKLFSGRSVWEGWVDMRRYSLKKL